MSIEITISPSDFDIAALHSALKAGNVQEGAVVTFTGLVREFSCDDRVIALELEHYPQMTEQLLLTIAQQAQQRWQLGRVCIYHRVGYLPLGEQIVFVGVSAKHRQGAFDGAQFIMDYLKTQATFWKKEHFSNTSKWVESKASDLQAKQKWEQ
ncbi:MAG: molybdenum cofactor biosynthesis protein MoaE [Pseudoalteromonas sp.]